MTTRNLPACLSASIAAIMLGACSGGGGGSEAVGDALPRGINDTYLHVTHQNQVVGIDSNEVVYFGTPDVGTEETLAVRIANRGADIYPLNNIVVTGANAEEFATQVLDEIELQPAEFVMVDITFQPITSGEKEAQFMVDYDTIQMVAEAVNINEQSYYKASDLELDGQFLAARSTYTDYLSNDPVTSNKRRAAIRLPIIDEARTYEVEEELGLYLKAMSERDERQYQQALNTLDVLASLYPDSYLADDAHYLKGYIQLMDLQDRTNAVSTMQALRDTYPDTTYYDTSLYSEAIALIEMGRPNAGQQILQALKARHTGIDALGIQLPKDNLTSRMWFERASQVLDTV